MKTQIAAGWVFAWLLALCVAGCGDIQWPPGCTPGDYQCLPCTYQQSTNPTCTPFPADAKKPKKEPTR